MAHEGVVISGDAPPNPRRLGVLGVHAGIEAKGTDGSAKQQAMEVYCAKMVCMAGCRGCYYCQRGVSRFGKNWGQNQLLLMQIWICWQFCLSVCEYTTATVCGKVGRNEGGNHGMKADYLAKPGDGNMITVVLTKPRLKIWAFAMVDLTLFGTCS